jgi:filamentous hemagglutinin family protein
MSLRIRRMKRFALSFGLLILVGLSSSITPALAQIRGDRTLSRPSVVTRRGNTLVITEGTQAGENLFHSFRQFSVSTGQTALFDNAATIRNIFARVTGRSISTIDGQIRANGSANLFLLNPNGILFGSNASLNIGGSFLATSANSINFADGSQFSAVAPQNVPLLTVSVPVGLQFGNNPGRIRARSIAPLPPRLDGYPLQGLQVPANQTLALVGGDVILPYGGLVAEQGRIEVGSVMSSGVVRLIPSQGWRLNYGGIQNFGNIRIGNQQGFNQSVFLDASGPGAGTIHLQGEQVTLSNAVLFAETLTDQNGAGISIRTSQLDLDRVALISTTTYGAGRGGDIQIRADQILIREQSQIEANTAANGRGGNVAINANVIQLEENQSGIVVRPTESSTAEAQGGNLSLQTDRLTILDGAQISTTTLGAGDSGRLVVRASEIELAGVAVNRNGDPILVDEKGQPTNDPRRGLAFPSGLVAGAERNSTGDGGSLTVITNRLSLRDGAALQTSTLSSGVAGDLTVRASEIEVDGTSPEGVFPTGILSLSGGIPGTGYDKGFRVATGRGGDIAIRTENLIVQDGAVVASGSLNRTSEAGAGNLTINAQFVSLDDRANVIANTNSGNGGDMTLRIQDLLLLRRGSGISTTAGIAGTGGNGGQITIDAEDGFIIASPLENSDITANAFEGTGGDIDINAQVIGITPRQNQTTESDITATSERGTSGRITISNPEVDPARGIVELPATVIDASQLIAQGCTPAPGEVSRFVATGRGGLPLSPDEPLREQAILTPNWVTLNSSPNQEDDLGQVDASENIFDDTVDSKSGNAIVEASGFGRDTNGKIVLVADAHPAVPVGSEMQVQCSRP